MAKPRKRALDEINLFTGKALIESDIFSDCAWAATVVLNPEQNYTEKGAWDLIRAFLDRRVG